MKFFAAAATLVAVAFAAPVDERDISIPAHTVHFPTLTFPTISFPSITFPALTIPGITIPTALTIPAYSTEIPFPSICPTSLSVSIPAITLGLPPLPTFTLTVHVTKTITL